MHREQPPTRPPTPTWVKGFAIAGGILLLLLVIGLVAVPGGHGPARHFGMSAASAFVGSLSVSPGVLT